MDVFPSLQATAGKGHVWRSSPTLLGDDEPVVDEHDCADLDSHRR